MLSKEAERLCRLRCVPGHCRDSSSSSAPPRRPYSLTSCICNTSVLSSIYTYLYLCICVHDNTRVGPLVPLLAWAEDRVPLCPELLHESQLNEDESCRVAVCCFSALLNCPCCGSPPAVWYTATQCHQVHNCCIWPIENSLKCFT